MVVTKAYRYSLSECVDFSSDHGVVKIQRRHLSIVDTGNCEAPFWAGCQTRFVLAGCFLLNYSSLLREEQSPIPALQPLFVLAGCFLLNYSSLLREGHSPTPALQPLFVLTGWLLLNYSSLLTEGHSPTPALQPFLYQLTVFYLITPAFSKKSTPPPLPSSHFLY